eukprot:CAMPEP_0119494720 /NCGR_PEP_ID=MMETSP1344-20130328/18581_1 /TAXON_ID=236787 /ORGANISM="Florenciella parvula, Strain CCMP2471" /LENGTH=50 /DNA_ID=CAMNT_0007530247 /DNA_START=45 /DNA_END=194 /DNA_ORIENTATION=+
MGAFSISGYQLFLVALAAAVVLGDDRSPTPMPQAGFAPENAPQNAPSAAP